MTNTVKTTTITDIKAEDARRALFAGDADALRQIEAELDAHCYETGDPYAAFASYEALGMRVILARRNPLRRFLLWLAGI